MKKILLPFDGSESAMRAVRYVLTVAKDSPQTEVALLHVVDPTTFGTDENLWKQDARGKFLADGERVLQPAKQLLDQAGVKYTSEVTLGIPGNDIPAYARNHACTTIVMGTRGLSPIASFFIGSVAHRVMQLAEVPVTLVK